MKKKLLLFCILMTSAWGYSQQLVWTGNAANNDFFDENNWQDSSTNLPPASGTIDTNQAINLNLQLHNANTTVIASGIINFGTGSLSITSSDLRAEAVSGGSTEINNNAYIDLNSNMPFQNNITINFNSGIAWVRSKILKVSEIQNIHLNQITVNTRSSLH